MGSVNDATGDSDSATGPTGDKPVHCEAVRDTRTSRATAGGADAVLDDAEESLADGFEEAGYGYGV